MEVAPVELAEELHSMLHKLMHKFECRFLTSVKPMNQLVADIQESGNCLKVVPDTLFKVLLREVSIVGSLLADNVGPPGETYTMKTLTHQVK
jgi:hypothetical protein